MTPEQFYAETVGKQIDIDGYPKDHPVQCIDGFRFWGQMNSVPIPPTPNNWADGYWYSRDKLGFAQWFEYITDPNQYKTGDWIIVSYYGVDSNGQMHQFEGEYYMKLTPLMSIWGLD